MLLEYMWVKDIYNHEKYKHFSFLMQVHYVSSKSAQAW